MPNYSAGPQLCTTTGQTPNGSSNPWANLNALTSNLNTFADATVQYQIPTYNAQATGFGFSLPVASTVIVNSYAFQIIRVASPHVGAPYSFPIDYAVYPIVYGSIPAGAINQASGPWPTTPTQFTYGSPTAGQWGTTLGAADVNDPSFGFQIAAENGPGTGVLAEAIVAISAAYGTIYYQNTVGMPSNGGVTAFERIGLYPMSDGNLYAFDPNSGYNDPIDGCSYFWRVEEIAVGRKPTIDRLFVTYRDLGQVTTTWTLTAVDDSQKVVTQSATAVLGNATPTGYLMTQQIFIPVISGMNMQLSVYKAAGAGSLSISKVKVCGRVELESNS